jgi:hypothetical protein
MIRFFAIFGVAIVSGLIGAQLEVQGVTALRLFTSWVR